MPVSPWTPDPPFTPDTPDPPFTPQTPQAGDDKWHVPWQRHGKDEWRHEKKCWQEWPNSWKGDSEEEVNKSNVPWQGYGNATKELQDAWQGYPKEEVRKWHDSWHRYGNADVKRSGKMLGRARGTATRGR